MVKDPVCGMVVNENKARYEADYKDKSYCFCSEDCKESFEKKPEQFVK
jgi:YHS domain-containing protein